MLDCVDVLCHDLKLPANLLICLRCVYRMLWHFILNFTVRQRYILNLKRVKQEKLPWMKIKKKPGLKKANKVKNSFDQDKKNFSWQQAIKVCGTTSPMHVVSNHPS